MMRGSQTYESEEGVFCVKAGDFLMIPAGKQHKFISAEYPVEKYAITFSYSALSDVFGIGLGDDCCHGRLTERIMDRIATVEKAFRKAVEDAVNARIAKSASNLPRSSGAQETESEVARMTRERSEARAKERERYEKTMSHYMK